MREEKGRGRVLNREMRGEERERERREACGATCDQVGARDLIFVYFLRIGWTIFLSDGPNNRWIIKFNNSHDYYSMRAKFYANLNSIERLFYPSDKILVQYTLELPRFPFSDISLLWLTGSGGRFHCLYDMWGPGFPNFYISFGNGES